MTVVVAMAAVLAASAADKPAGAIDLFDGKSLAGWEHYLVKPDVKMADVWSVRDGLLICKGKPMGYLATKKEYTNYKLVVEWRWAPGKKAGNSGVLMRITGEPKALPKCAEAQLKSGSAGDIYGFHGFKVKGDAARLKSAHGEMIGQLSGVSKIKGNEKEPGEWNRYDITLNGGDLTLIINGEKVNEATGLDIVAGKIGFQSEGGEIHFRTIRLIPLEDAVTSRDDGKTRVLFVYGGAHHSPITPYIRMLDSMEGIEWTPALMPQSAGMLKPGLENEYDALLMVQMMGERWGQPEATPEQRKAFDALLKKGIGVVALHQAIATEPGWVESPMIVGGVWRNEEYEVGGKSYPKSGCLHDTDMNIKACDPNHPIVKGVPEFVINDELYLDIYKAEDNVPILVTDHPQAKGRKEIAWTRTYGASKVFYFQLGHIPAKTWARPDCRRIVRQGILWAAGDVAAE